ncbi:MAG TPA: BMP family ABC transporter substrate-binding protein [Actinomycetota bacterium]|nr:BMP family ABC transporter substrate-binding protein [Actinomycetota bacterium]
MRRRLRLASVAALFAVVAMACGTGSGGSDGDASQGGGGGGDDVVKAAWVYVGPRDDGGWTTAHDNGRLAVEEEFGDQVETAFIENVPEEPAEAERAIEGFARKGYDIIFTTSFGFMDPTLKVAQKYPDVLFEHCSGFKSAENMANYFGAMEEAKYLAGIAAAQASEKDFMGSVLAFPIPEVVRLTNAFLLGAQSVNPDARMKVIFTNSWFDPQAEKSAAESLVDAGADLLSQDVDSPATGQVAEAAGLKWVGYNSDASQFAPKAWVTAPVWDWSGYYIDRIQAVIDGTWETHSYYGHIGDGIVGLAPYGPSVTDETKQMVEDVEQQMIEGAFEPFQGPITDQDGKLRVKEGESLSLDELLAMDWWVEGMEGERPPPAG